MTQINKQMTKKQYLKQLGKWFTLKHKNGIRKYKKNGTERHSDVINQKQYDYWFDFFTMDYPSFMESSYISDMKQEDEFELPKIYFIHFCIENNLCNKTLEEAMVIFKLVHTKE